MDLPKDLELWSTFGKICIGFLVGLMSIYVKHFLQKKEKQEEDRVAVKYLALRLAFLFEGYAVECADKATDHQLADDTGREAGRFIGKVPEMPPLPMEEGQKILDHSHLNDIWDFPQRCVMANSNARFWDDIGESERAANAFRINTIKMGFRAMGIGSRLRKKYDLSPRLLAFEGFDMEKFFKEKVEKIEANEESKKRRKRSGRTRRK